MPDYKSKLESEEMDFLFDAILGLKDREECYKFFEDVCTILRISKSSIGLEANRLPVIKWSSSLLLESFAMNL